MKMPVTWLRQADRKLRRNSCAAADMQRLNPITERGKLDSALRLLAVKEPQIRPRCGRVFDDEDREHSGENDEEDHGQDAEHPTE